MFHYEQKFIAGEIPAYTQGSGCYCHYVTATPTGTTQGEDDIEYNVLFWVDTTPPDKIAEYATSVKAKFIQEYLVYKGFGINEQIAAMANGEDDLTEYQTIRGEAKELATAFIAQHNTEI